MRTGREVRLATRLVWSRCRVVLFIAFSYGCAAGSAVAGTGFSGGFEVGQPDVEAGRLHSVISLELACHFTGMKFDPGLLIAEELTAVLAE
jgi:hypothetical protein